VHELKVARGRLVLAALSLVALSGSQLLVPWPMKLVFDQVLLNKPLHGSMSFLAGLFTHGDTVSLLIIVGAIVVIALMRSAFAYAENFITAKVGYEVMHAVRRELFGHTQRLSLAFHTRARAGELLTRITRDCETVLDAVSGWGIGSLSDVLTLFGMFAVLFVLDWELALLPLVSFPILYVALRHLYQRTKDAARRQRAGEGRIADRVSEVIMSVALVQAYGREEHEAERLEHEGRLNMDENVRTARLEGVSGRTTDIVTAVATAGVVLFGALQVTRGELTPGELLVFTGYLSSMYRPVRSLARTSTKLSSAAVSVERMSELLELEPDILDAPDAVPAPRLRGAIAFSHVSFAYDPTFPVLEGLSFQVEPGQRVALIGPSGAGKSTIASLVLRFYDPLAGSVSVDGIDLRRLQLATLRAQIAIVPQDSVVFGTTIRENIAYGRPGASDEEIVEAATAANAHDFIVRLEDGYDTVVGERGATLSGGQRRRIAIARALVRDAPILILDEPMTGLDAASEASVREALDRLMAGRTCLTITHDLHSVEDSDLILVLEAGRIVEEGRHEEILARSPSYRRLVQLQGGGLASDAAVLASAFGAAAEPNGAGTMHRPPPVPIRRAAASEPAPPATAAGRLRRKAAAGGLGVLAAVLAGGVWWGWGRTGAPAGGGHISGLGPAPPVRAAAVPPVPAYAQVPALVGRRLPAARASATGLRLRVRRVRAAAPAGAVLAQRPAAGARVARGSTLVVTVAVGRRRAAPPPLPKPPAPRVSAPPAAPAAQAPPLVQAQTRPAPAAPPATCPPEGTWGAGWGAYHCR